MCLERQLSSLVILVKTKATAVRTLEEKAFLLLFWQVSKPYYKLNTLTKSRVSSSNRKLPKKEQFKILILKQLHSVSKWSSPRFCRLLNRSPTQRNKERSRYATSVSFPAASNNEKAVPTFMNPLNGVKWKSNKVTIKNNLGFWTDDTASSTSLSGTHFFIQDCFLVPYKFPVHLSQLLFRQHAFHLLLCI